VRCFSSFQELDALGEGLSRDYTKKTHKWNTLCFDIEGFITDYLGLTIQHENFAEEDACKIGFLANGLTPLKVMRNGKLDSIVFPKDTIVIERYLLRNEESSRRRFTLAHEAAHKVLERHIPIQTTCFHSEFDAEAEYSIDDMERIFSLNENLTNRLAAAILMPPFLIEKALKRLNDGNSIVCYEGGVFAQKEKISVQKIADSLGVSYSALINRLRELQRLEILPIEEYIEKKLCFGERL